MNDILDIGEGIMLEAYEFGLHYMSAKTDEERTKVDTNFEAWLVENHFDGPLMRPGFTHMYEEVKYHKRGNLT